MSTHPAPHPPSGPPIAPGTLLLERYEVRRVLGRGAMGEVLEVYDKHSGNTYALKRVPTELARDPLLMQNVRANFGLVCNLAHPHIAGTRQLELDPQTGDAYLILEFVRGCDLAHWIAQERAQRGSPEASIPLPAVLGIAEQIAAALDYAHAQPASRGPDGRPLRYGILHRDLKPANVMVEGDRNYRPGVPYIKLVDFGLAAEIQASLTGLSLAPQKENVAGTPSYMAPEQWDGRTLTRGTDQWALAVMLYEMAAGRRPFRQPTATALYVAIREAKPERPACFSEAQWSALRKTFQADRRQRYRSCLALVKALAAADAATEGTVLAAEMPLPEEAVPDSDAAQAVPAALPKPAAPVPVAPVKGANAAEKALVAPRRMRPLMLAGMTIVVFALALAAMRPFWEKPKPAPTPSDPREQAARELTANLPPAREAAEAGDWKRVGALLSAPLDRLDDLAHAGKSEAQGLLRRADEFLANGERALGEAYRRARLAEQEGDWASVKVLLELALAEADIDHPDFDAADALVERARRELNRTPLPVAAGVPNPPAAASDQCEKLEASLHLGAEGLEPGGRMHLAVRIRVAEGCAIGPGAETGSKAVVPTRVRLAGPAGFRLEELRFPKPQTLKKMEGDTIPFLDGEVWVMGTLAIPPDLAEGEHELDLRVAAVPFDDKQVYLFKPELVLEARLPKAVAAHALHSIFFEELARRLTEHAKEGTPPAAAMEVTLNAPTSFTLQEFPAPVGAVLRKREPIGQLSSIDMSRLRMELEAAQFEWNSKSALLSNLPAAMATERILRGEGGAAGDYDVPPEKKKAAEAALAAAKARLTLAQAAYDRSHLVMPFDGTIVTYHAEIGEMVQAGQPFVTVRPLMPESGGEIRLPLHGPLRELNPLLTVDTDGYELNQLLFDPLVRRSVDETAWEPGLAESWQVNETGDAITFILRENARWHDGNPVTARDVVFTVNTIKALHDQFAMGDYYRQLASADAEGDRRVRLVWANPPHNAFERLARLQPIPEHRFRFTAVEEFTHHPNNQKPVGSGPWRLAAFSAEETAVVPHADYYGRVPHLNRMVFKVIGSSAGAELLEKGEVDALALPPPVAAAKQKDATFVQRFKFSISSGSSYSYCCWNLARPMFQDKRVRTALSLLIDRDLIAREAYGGLAQPCLGPIHPEDPDYLPGLVNHKTHDPERAGKLLAEAGWIDRDGDGVRDLNGKPFAFTLIARTPPEGTPDPASYVKAALAQAGIRMDIEFQEWAVLLRDVFDRKFDACLLGWLISPEDDLYQIWHSSQAERGSNFGGFRNAEADGLLEQARSERDTVKRREILHRFQELLLDEQPNAFLMIPMHAVAYDKRLRGVAYRMSFANYSEWWIPRSEQKR